MTGVIKVDDIQDAGANSIVSSNGSGTLTLGSFTAPNITASTAILPDASDGAAIGSASLEWSDLFLADGAVINFGDDQEVTLTHVADTGLLISSTDKLMFNDASQFIQGTSATVLDIAATDEIELTATLIDVVGNLAVSGTLAQADAITMATNKKIIFRDAAIHISSTADGDLSIAADDEIDITSTLIDINGNVEISGTAVTTGVHTFTAVPVFPNNTIETADIQADAIDGTKIADDAINSEHYTDGSIDTAHIAADQIVASLIADNAINSEHYTDGSIDTAHIAADQIVASLIADDAINSEHYTDGSIDTAHIADAQITAAKLAAGVNVIKMADAWRTSAAATFSSSGYITANWERVDTDGYGGIGTGMSESSGAFTFPATGIYLVQGHISMLLDGTRTYMGGNIDVTLNNSDYSAATELYNRGINGSYVSLYLSFILDVTNTSNVKVKLRFEGNGSCDVLGQTNSSKTGMSFIRLGDT